MKEELDGIELSQKTKAKLKRHNELLDVICGGKSVRGDVFIRSLHNVTRSMSQDHDKVSVCKKGCSYCCKLNVDVTQVEAMYIAYRLGENSAIEAGYQSGFVAGSYCPFHNDDTKTCAIYDFRPIACQLFASVDSVEFCKTPDVTHKILTQFSMGADNFKRLVEPLEQNSGHNDEPVYADIREWFRVKAAK